MTDKCVVYLSAVGYKISSIFGKILFGGRSWDHLRDAMIFCDENSLNYFVA